MKILARRYKCPQCGISHGEVTEDISPYINEVCQTCLWGYKP